MARGGGCYTLNTIDRPAVYDEDPLRVRGGGKGPLIQNDRSATLGTNNDQTLFCDVYNQEITGSIAPSMTAATGGGNTSGPKVLAAGFSFGNSANARSIGYQEEMSPTLRGGDGGNQKPCIVSGGGLNKL